MFILLNLLKIVFLIILFLILLSFFKRFLFDTKYLKNILYKIEIYNEKKKYVKLLFYKLDGFMVIVIGFILDLIPSLIIDIIKLFIKNPDDFVPTILSEKSLEYEKEIEDKKLGFVYKTIRELHFISKLVDEWVENKFNEK